MDSKFRGGLLVGAGFLLGTVGIKALTSPQARKCYVKGVACGLRAKESYERIVEEAKAEVDDIVAEASYLNSVADAADGQGGDADPAGSDGAAAPEPAAAPPATATA